MSRNGAQAVVPGVMILFILPFVFVVEVAKLLTFWRISKKSFDYFCDIDINVYKW
jgi:hypothetical protein